MGKPCRLSFFAFRDKDPLITYGPVGVGHFTPYDLENGIAYCEWLIKDFGLKREPLDDFSLRGFIRWAKRLLKESESNVAPTLSGPDGCSTE